MRIQDKLFIALLTAGSCLVVLCFAFMHWSLKHDLIDYAKKKEADILAPFIQALITEFNTTESWQFIADKPHLLFTLLNQNVTDKSQLKHLITPPPLERFKQGHQSKPRDRGHIKPPPKHERLKHHYPRHERSGPRKKQKRQVIHLAIFDAEKKRIVGKERLKQHTNWIAIKNNSRLIGWLATYKKDHFFNRYQADLLAQQEEAYIIIGCVLLLLNFFIAWPLAKHLTSPIKLLAHRLNELAQGQYAGQLDLKRKDELGQLSRDVNQLAITLSKNETLRKRWFANISHELRTPIAILRGETEAMLDGIRPINRTQIVSFEQEIKRLQRLVEDLYELSAADIGGLNYRKKQLNLTQLLQQELVIYENTLQESNIQLISHFTLDDVLIWADSDRICQLLNNLIFNAAKYAGENTVVTIELTQDRKQGRAHIIISDNGVGVNKEELPLLFEHLYRVENSRNRQTGGSGLGLALCQQIVEAHQGTITAKQAQPQGLAIHIYLPLTSLVN